ncbi:MAG: D-alanine--D-alanine ligase [Thermodesulfovibrionales bacterium]|nr:D-alanine--D-alanine ligase [Thermodesulfovibrionales bacterium]
MKDGLRIGVLLGGTSAEREVSLKSGAAVSGALRELGYDVVDIDVGADLCARLRQERVELAFIALHGGTGEDGSVQGLLEVMGIPYTGSGVLASAVAMDKVFSKTLFERAGIKVPGYEVISSMDEKVKMPLPVVVKPSREGSSIGVFIVTQKEELKDALEAALEYEGPALVERYIKGKEVQIGVLGERALGGVEVRPTNEFYDYEAKYTAGKTQYILPPEMDERSYALAMEAGLAAHRALGCGGATRVDLLVDGNDIYALEVNTIPGMTETSLLPKIAALSGLDFKALLEEIVKDALAGRAGERKMK